MTRNIIINNNDKRNNPHSTIGLQPDLNLQSALTGNIVVCTLHEVLFACSNRGGQDCPEY
jgi:hypothetical protein